MNVKSKSCKLVGHAVATGGEGGAGRSLAGARSRCGADAWDGKIREGVQSICSTTRQYKLDVHLVYFECKQCPHHGYLYGVTVVCVPLAIKLLAGSMGKTGNPPRTQGWRSIKLSLLVKREARHCSLCRCVRNNALLRAFLYTITKESEPETFSGMSVGHAHIEGRQDKPISPPLDTVGMGNVTYGKHAKLVL